MTVRPVTEEDRDVLAAVLARAFADDPVMRWAYGPPKHGTRRVRQELGEQRFFAWALARLTDQGVSWTTEARAGAALWALPDRWRETPGDVLRLSARTATAVGLRGVRVLRGLGRVERLHPEGRHLYLQVLGVDPSAQGTGIGSALLRPGLELCDAEGLPAYLETATERNLAFYARHGFRVTHELTLPRGPRIWTLWREPAG